MRSMTPSRLAKMLGCFFVAILLLAQFSHAQAGPGPVAVATATISGTVVAALTPTPVPPTYGVINGGFGVNNICDKSYWSIDGSYTLSAPRGNCYVTLGGKLVSSGSGPITATSYLEQTFIVNPSNPYLYFYLRPTSTNPALTYPAQTVSLYSSTGALIYQKSRNANNPDDCGFLFEQSLQGYGGQAVRLRISTTMSTVPGAPQGATLNVDFDGFSWDCSGPSPDDPPITRW
jgi:hypothetical protein